MRLLRHLGLLLAVCLLAGWQPLAQAEGLIAAEAFLDDPALLPGTGTPLVLDGEATETLRVGTGALDLTGVEPGPHTLYLRFQDAGRATGPSPSARASTSPRATPAAPARRAEPGGRRGGLHRHRPRRGQRRCARRHRRRHRQRLGDPRRCGAADQCRHRRARAPHPHPGQHRLLVAYHPADLLRPRGRKRRRGQPGDPGGGGRHHRRRPGHRAAGGRRRLRRPGRDRHPHRCGERRLPQRPDPLPGQPGGLGGQCRSRSVHTASVCV